MLITKEIKEEKISFRIRLTESLLQEIEDYCQWANISNKEFFIQQSCRYIFTKDQVWINYKQSKL